MDNIPEMGDEADAPIIVPPPGQILRRTARTKIRKPGLPGDGGGHRFGSSRRVNTNPAPATDPRSSSEMSTSDHGDPDPTPGVTRRHTVSDDGSQIMSRPDSYSEEAIYDAYARDDEEDLRLAPVLVNSSLIEEEPLPLPLNNIPQMPEGIPQQDPVVPILQQPQPQRPLMLPPQMQSSSPPVPGISASAPLPGHHPLIADSPPIPISTTTSPPRKEKDKKGLFGKWGGDKGGKKGSKVKDRDDRVTAAEKEKESGFFGSLFGKKKQDSDSLSITGGSALAGREAAQALLGASKSSKAYPLSTSPGLSPGADGNPYARYPIHVERAIYRLSHIKLANPRRPLYEQVLISNLMFWYLGVINKAQNPTPPTQPAQTEGVSNENLDDKDLAEKEREREKEQRENFEKLESERLEKEQRELELKKKESGRRGSLNKMNSGIPSGGGRHAEMPVKGPQYEKQHRVMEQEYGPYNGQPPRGPTSLVNGPLTQQYSRSPTPPQYGVIGQHYQARPENNSRRPSLPPGAMAPADQSPWMAQPSPQPRRPSPNPLDPASQHQSTLPPPQNQHGQETQLMQLPKLNTSQESLGDRIDPRHSGRSLSATTPPAPVILLTNGHVRKGKSAHAVMYHEQRPRSEEQFPSGEEEDLPLAAVWQRRRK